MARKRAGERDIVIPPVADPVRRAACEADAYLCLKTYWPRKYCKPWTDDQRLMIAAVLYRIRYGGDQAIAAPRGGGKTAIVEGVIVYALLVGLLSFPVVVAATGPAAARIFKNIKKMFERSPELAADFPEVVAPILALERAPARGNMQTVDGEFTNLQWTSDAIVLPTVKGSKCSGAMLIIRGIDAEIRGVREDDKRPDFVLIDDCETRESAGSTLQIEDRELAIENDIAGLAGPGERLSRVMLCTIQNRKCLAYRYTDRTIKPTWNGRRTRFLVKPPENEALWDEYLSLLREGQEKGNDPTGRAAMAFYESHRAEMDAGSEVSNPHRFVTDPAEDGTPLEISALQHYYNWIHRSGKAFVQTELDNDPQEEAGPQTSGITDALVRSRVNGLDHRILPADSQALTAFIDLGDHACHWEVAAWLPGATRLTLDHGVEEVYDFERGIDRAIVNALLRWRARILAHPYLDDHGKPRTFDMVLVDSGYREDAAFEFVRQVGGPPFRASKGFGSQHRTSPFARQTQSKGQKRRGHHWIESYLTEKRIWLFEIDVDHWKGFVHDRFLTPTFNDDGTIRRGSASLWGKKEKEHFAFSKHIVAEMREEEFIPGKGTVRKWNVKNANNHWLDCAVGNSAAADACGVKLFAGETNSSKQRTGTNWFGALKKRSA
jgi:hypothetical protein